jgi:RNA polymerase subunit RPABC4/transcription elongation factor Spt4
MFFLIAGIQPKTKVVDTAPRLCPVCGLQQACLKRTDHYLSLFFIPVFPVKYGEPFLACTNCERLQYGQQPQEAGYKRTIARCTACGRDLEKDFSFCPYCGRRM